jgi:hypothetical protein
MNQRFLMNSNRSGRSSDNDDLTTRLQTFRPAKANIDPAALFYQAGFNAGQMQRTSGRIPQWPVMAASLVAVLLAAPLGYLIGQSSSKPRQVAAEPQRSADVQVAMLPTSLPSVAPSVEPPHEELDAVASTESSFFSTYAPILISLWGQPSAETDRPSPDQPAASLAAFHSFVSSSSGNRKQWPEYFVQCDALLHSDPSITTVRSDVLRRSTMAVGDAQQMATMMEAIR